MALPVARTGQGGLQVAEVEDTRPVALLSRVVAMPLVFDPRVSDYGGHGIALNESMAPNVVSVSR